MTKRRRIAAITGTRAEYGIIRPVLEEIAAHPNLELVLIVMAQHLSPDFGYTIREIEQDGFKIGARVETLLSSDSLGGMTRALGLAVIELTQAIEMIQPDIIMVTGDRGEMLAGAIVGAHMNIPVAHLHGGEVSGTVDELIRHAITKFAHIHFAATEQSAQRIKQLGEDERRIFIVGAVGLDEIRKGKFLRRDHVLRKLNFDGSKPILLVSQHPVTTEIDEADHQMRETMEAIKDLGLQTVLIYPNSDAGGRKMRQVIEEYLDLEFIRVFKNISRDMYLGVMNVADVMIGNSSSGIIEAPFFQLPFINIGTRQQGRQRAGNVIDVPYERQKIKEAIEYVLNNRDFRSAIGKVQNPYDLGMSGPKIAKILATIEINRDLVQKRLRY